jgi:hypothetical protein
MRVCGIKATAIVFLWLILACYCWNAVAAQSPIADTTGDRKLDDFATVGIIYRPKSKNSLVYLRFRNNEIKSYSPGSMIDGWKLVSINPQSFRVRRGDTVVAYSLSHRSGSFVAEKTTSQKVTRLKTRSLKPDFSVKLDQYINGRVLASVPYPYGVFSYGIERIDEHLFMVDRKSIIDQAKNNNVIEHARYEFDQGLIMTEIVPGSLFDGAGILVGDKISKINDKPVQGEAGLFDLIKALMTTNMINTEVIRDNVSYRFDYHVLDSGKSAKF